MFGAAEPAATVDDDVAAIVGLLADDCLGASRELDAEGAVAEPYVQAFAAIEGDPSQLLVVAAAGDDVVGTFQLSFIPGLARTGALRAQVEAVRVREEYRDAGLGTAMLEWAIGEARRRGCALMQLTTDKARPEALHFYERLGFVASHVGLKLSL